MCPKIYPCVSNNNSHCWLKPLTSPHYPAWRAWKKGAGQVESVVGMSPGARA